MAKKTSTAPIEPDKLYRIAFSRRIEHDGKRYIPRAGVTVRLLGAVVEQIKDQLDGWALVRPANEG